MTTQTQKIAIATCLWFDKNAEEAATFYAKTFPNSRVTAVRKSPTDYPNGKAGDVLTVEFTLLGQAFLGLNGGPGVPHSDAVSFQVFTDTQEETDHLWNAIVKNGGQEVACSWCKDKFGLSWQIVPRALMDGMNDPDPAAAKRVMEAMMQMVKIDIAKIELARRGGAARRG
jgi:2-polyprenyl-6-hydroxyphenyl methylase/3-demethylubiquinone-9 3-methyltransferase